MIKSAGHIIVIIMLLFGTTGLSITRHYCGNSLVSTSVYSVPAQCCNSTCPGCHDEIIKFRVTDQFESSQPGMDFNAGFKTLNQVHSLPVLLAYSAGPGSAHLNYDWGDRCIKPSHINPLAAGNTPSFLQVFLF